MIAELTPRQRWILLAASLAVGLAFLDETAVVTALRAIQHDFNASNTEVQWVIGAYLLALASLMAAAGRLADMYGRHRYSSSARRCSGSARSPRPTRPPRRC